MQSLAIYGRLLARAFVSGLNNELGVPSTSQTSSSSCFNKCPARPLHLVTALSGTAKAQSSAQIRHKWSFGDDACFLSSQKLADVIGVADGVGGWRNYGIDPSHFARSLMDTCERLVLSGRFAPHRPKDLIVHGYNELQEDKDPLLGSCTACIVALHKEDKTLYSANLGDSGFLIIRRGEVVHRSEEQQHYFNTPFQLSIAPPVLQGQVLGDSPQSADSSSFPVLEGDVIVVGTDGLFDNLSEDMILHHITKLKDHRKENVQKIANALVQEAHTLAFDPEYMSPFAFHAADNGFDIKGGKPDDVTVILARVAASEATS